MADKIVVLDFGSQYNQLIARRIREFGVYSELHSNEMTLKEIQALGDVKGIVFSGGPNSIYEEDAPKCDPAILESGIPILGICYGMQLMQYVMGGKVEKADSREYGRTEIDVVHPTQLFEGLPEHQTVWMSHGIKVTDLAPGFEQVAKSDNCPYAAAADVKKGMYCLQFHPEVRHSEYGNDILKNFVFKICQAEANWSMKNFIEVEKEKIREQVGDDKVLLGLSGGVDSSVVAALLHEAIGDQLICMFIDHGLLRKGEGESVMETFGKNMNVNLVKIDAKDRFLKKLEGVSDLEKKRKEYEEDSDEYKDLTLRLEGVSKAKTYIRDSIQTKFENQMTKYQQYSDDARVAMTDSATRGSRLELISTRLTNQKATFKELQQDNEGIDITEVAVELTASELTYNAALMATGKIMQTNLMNYI